MAILITAKDLIKDYGKGKDKIRAVGPIDFTIVEGSFTVILGKSGSGKSTLLNLLAGLDNITEGSLVVDGPSLGNINSGKQLATQSSAATKEIEKIVSTIQRETSEVTQAMELSTSQVVEGTKSVEQTKLSLKEIISQSKEIDAFLQSISKSAIEQVKSSESMKLVMAGVAEVSTQTSVSSSQVSTSLQATVAIARELQTVVGKFKVNADKN